jgi:MtN3 and saliva related transmembrane protein
MDGQRVLEIVTSTWGVAMAVSPVMQIRRMLETGESGDVSIGYWAVLCVGFMLWVAYGLSIDSRVLWGCNIVATIFGVATMIIALRLRRRIDAG